MAFKMNPKSPTLKSVGRYAAPRGIQQAAASPAKQTASQKKNLPEVIVKAIAAKSPAKQSTQGDYEKGLEQKHIVKSKTSTKGDNDNVKRSSRSEVTNIESKSNKRIQKVSGNDSKDKKGYKSTLITVKDPNKSGRLVVGPKGGHHEMGSDVAQEQLKNFQRNYLKTKNK